LSVRLSDEERQLVDQAAESAHLTPAGYAGKATVAAAGREVAPSAGLADGLKELQRELFAARRAVNMFASNVNQAAAQRNSTGELPDWAAEAVHLCRAAVARLDEVTGRIDRRLR
jgi:predicted transcriptional regulator